MTFKAADFEKKMGTCPQHGEQVLWLVCKHVGKESPGEILLGPDRVAVCPACSMLPVNSIEEYLVVACEGCMKKKIKALSARLPEDGNIYDYVKGLEVYEEELCKDE